MMGQVCRKICEDLWIADRVLNLGGLKLPIRMTVLRLRDGGLFLHSPVALDTETREALDAIGPTRYLVAPNRVHHLFVGHYLKAYPDARAYACPGLPEKRRDLAFHGVLSDAPPPGWAREIEQLLFRGLPYLQEVIFFHPATRTLILTDLVFNARREDAWFTRMFFRMYGVYQKFGPTWLVKLLIRDRAAARASLDQVLAWDFDRVVMTHGEIVESGGKELLGNSFPFLNNA